MTKLSYVVVEETKETQKVEQHVQGTGADLMKGAGRLMEHLRGQFDMSHKEFIEMLSSAMKAAELENMLKDKSVSATDLLEKLMEHVKND